MLIRFIVGYIAKSENGKAQWPMWMQNPGGMVFSHHAVNAHQFEDEKLAQVYIDDLRKRMTRNPVTLLLFIAPVEV